LLPTKIALGSGWEGAAGFLSEAEVRNMLADKAPRGPAGREEINLPANKYNGLGAKLASEEITPWNAEDVKVSD
jgi:hypothetical protein